MNETPSRSEINRLINERNWNALVEIGEPAVEALVALLNTEVKKAAVEALKAIGDVRAVEILRLILLKSQPGNRANEETAQALETLGWTPVSEDEQIAFYTVKRQWQMLGPLSVQGILKVINTLTFRMHHSEIIRALRQMRTPVMHELIAAVHDKNHPCRLEATGKLWMTESAEAVPLLVEALSDESPEIRRAAAESLTDLMWYRWESVILPAKWVMQWSVFSDKWRPASREEYRLYRVALRNLERPTREDTTIEEMLAMLNESHYLRFCGAARLAAIYKDKRAVEPLIAALSRRNYVPRASAAYALGEIGDVRAVEPLIRLMNDKHHKVRRMAWQALKKIGTPEAMAVVENHASRRYRSKLNSPPKPKRENP